MNSNNTHSHVRMRSHTAIAMHTKKRENKKKTKSAQNTPNQITNVQKNHNKMYKIQLTVLT